MKNLKTYYLMVIVALCVLLIQSKLFATAPATLVSPVSIDCVDPTSMTFTWTAPVSGTIVSYGIQVSTTSTFTSPWLVLDVSGINPSSTTFSTTIPRYAGPYNWRVSSSFSDASNIYSSASTFTTITPNTVMTVPTNGATCAHIDGVAVWTAPLAGSENIIEINTSATFNPGSIVYTNFGTPTTSTTLSLVTAGVVNNTTYFWRMQSNRYVGDGCWSGWGNSNTFTTIPANPVITTPAHGSGCISRNAAFMWTASPVALNYNLEVYNSPIFGPANLVFSSSTITSTSYTVLLPVSNQQYWSRVRSNYVCGFTDWSTTTSFTTQQPVPSPLLPANGTNSISFTTSLSWTPVSPVSSYRVQVADNPLFIGADVDVSGITSNSYTVTVPSIKTNTLFYWRVSSSFSTCQSDWSNTFSFKTIYGGPTPLSPLNHRTCTPTDYRFQWLPVTGATGYRIQVSTDASFTNLLVNQNNIQELYADVTGMLALTQYYWRVRAEDATNMGSWSNIWDFVSNIPITQLLSPPNNAGGYPLSINLVWGSVFPGAIYNLQVADNPQFDLPFYNTNTSSTTYTVSVPNYNVTYYWRVSATVTPCSSTYSDTWAFRTVLSAPVLTAPANSSNGQPSDILFQWQPVSGATSYEYNISASTSFTPVLRGIEQSATNYYLTGLLQPLTTYYWRVRAKNADGASPWSIVWHFTTHLAGPAIPILQFPGNNATTVPLTVTVKWYPAANALKYHMQLASNNQFLNNIYDLNTLTSTTYTVTGLENFKNYWWRVSAINDSGETNYSQIWKFTTIDVLPGAPVLATPANNMIDADTSLQFNWYAAPSQSTPNYKFQLATSNSFTAGSIITDDDTFNLYELIDGINPLTQYYWRVRATNEAGAGPWSTVWNFKTKQTVGVNDLVAARFGISAFPNPFTESTIIHFNVPEPNKVIVKLVNTLGADVVTLVNKYMPQGEQNINLDSRNLTSGLYWYVVQIGDYREVNKLVLIK